ncbi:unnamed protein product [Brachionus calyciflorus]|uniref:HAUS augmin-like complex subunit 1 n=1 Tax=Brachionus calyciflorus TaxID=104777 RepID=A0A813M0F2_9BILA|nr:unnamed protein product [Brachionus calyciflorus]
MNKKLAEEIENLELKNYKHWSSYYAKEAEKSQALLKLFGFSKNDLFLSEKCSKSFNALVSMAMQLKLESVNETNFSISLRELISKKFDLEAKLNERVNETSDLNEKLLQLNLFRETLLKDSKSLESQISTEKENLQEIEMKIQFMKGKMEKYKTEISEMKYHNDTIDKNLFHEKILSDFQNMKIIQKQFQEARAQLDTYQGLPMNMNLAQLKIQQLANEIESLEHQIDELMGFMN